MENSLDIRKKIVLRAVVREYCASAEPVGSGTIVVKYKLGVSPATVRSDMADLEDRGFLEQPHTSAGRVPTEKGYRFYVDELVEPRGIDARHRERLESAVAAFERDIESAMRELAKTIATLAGETVFVSAGDKMWYVTGVANLVGKPEFRDHADLMMVSAVLDELDALTAGAASSVRSDVDVLIGDENPFASTLASVMARFDAPGGGEGMLGILGPTRMDYDANLALARCIRELFSRS